MTQSPLPYTDTKPQGAPDFYYAVNATFRFIESTQGRAGWIEWLHAMGRDYFAPVNQQWREGGLPAIATYWRAFFNAEPGGEVVIHEHPGAVEIEVRQCPAIAQLRLGEREIVPFFCQHCYHLGSARARESGFDMRLQGGNGSCSHRYTPADPLLPPQEMGAIRETTGQACG